MKAVLLCLFSLAFVIIHSIEIPIHSRETTCMVIISSFDPIKVQAKFPSVGGKRQEDQFKITLVSLLTNEEEDIQYMPDNSVFRKNYQLVSNRLYELCFEFVTDRNLGDQIIYISYLATQDFESLIGRIQIPAQLSKEENLKKMYEIASKMASIGNIVSEHQQKERQLEEKLVGKNVHKNERIVTLTIIQIAVIILAGIYQIFALRKFLIDKNLY